MPPILHIPTVIISASLPFGIFSYHIKYWAFFQSCTAQTSTIPLLPWHKAKPTQHERMLKTTQQREYRILGAHYKSGDFHQSNWGHSHGPLQGVIQEPEGGWCCLPGHARWAGGNPWKPILLKQVFKSCAGVCAFLGVKWSHRGLAEHSQLCLVPPQIGLAISGSEISWHCEKPHRLSTV